MSETRSNSISFHQYFTKRLIDGNVVCDPIEVVLYDGTLISLEKSISKTITREKFGNYEYVTHLPYVFTSYIKIFQDLDYLNASEIHIEFYGKTLFRGINSTKANNEEMNDVGQNFIIVVELGELIDIIFRVNIDLSTWYPDDEVVPWRGSCGHHPLFSIDFETFLILVGISIFTTTAYLLWPKRK
jgi:hypothetical protein